MQHDTITFLIVAMGGATVFLSFFVAYRFWWHHRNMNHGGRALSKALTFQLIGEAAIGVVTLIFALLAWSGRLPHVGVEFQSMLRFVAFLATSATTIHLAMVIEKLHND